LKYASIITARTSSSRLPRKILKNITKHYKSIDILIFRAKKIGLPIILATSKNSYDDDLCDYVKQKHNILIFRGNEKNKILRWYSCFNKFKISKACMIDGDDICFDYNLYKKAIQINLKKYEIIKYPDNIITGCFMYIMQFSFIKKLNKISKKFVDTEMIEPFIERLNSKKKYLKIDNIYKSQNIRLTLDYKEDLFFFKKIFKKFSIIEKTSTVIDFLIKNKKISRINFFRQKNYLNNQKKKISNMFF
jgi:spore coat polysaccharide biosynthesis protein SpsF